jgi:hypothetical protein
MLKMRVRVIPFERMKGPFWCGLLRNVHRDEGEKGSRWRDGFGGTAPVVMAGQPYSR